MFAIGSATSAQLSMVKHKGSAETQGPLSDEFISLFNSFYLVLLAFPFDMYKN